MTANERKFCNNYYNALLAVELYETTHVPFTIEGVRRYQEFKRYVEEGREKYKELTEKDTESFLY